MNDLQWTSNGYSHTDVLARELGYTPVYLHYNTGLHMSVNGQQFANLLEVLLKAWPQPVEDLTLLVHSMGGLVSRSARHVAEQTRMAWRNKLKNCCGQVISDSEISFFGVDSRSKALGDMLPSFECSLMLL